MSFELILHLAIGISGLVLIYQDFKSKSVSVFPLFLFLGFCGIIGFITKNFCYFPCLVFLGVGSGFYLLKKKQAFGIADYIVVFAVSFLISNDNWPFLLILSGAFGILIAIIFKNQKFPFVPSLLVATLLIEILENFRFN